MALYSAVIEQSTSKVFSYFSTKLEDKASRANTITRIEIAVARMGIALEKTGRIPTTKVSLLHSWNHIKGVYMEGKELLKKHGPQEENHGQVVVRNSSYLQWIADRAVNFPISSLVGLGKEEMLCSSVAQKFERSADWAEKFVAEVESGCPLRHDITFRYPFVRQLLEGRTLRCQIVKNPSQSLSLHLQPVIVEGRGVEVTLRYEYKDLRTLEQCFKLGMMLRISENTDIIGISNMCMLWLTAQFKLALESPIRELTLLPSLQDTFNSPPSFVEEKIHAVISKHCRPDPICCNRNSYGSLANKSSMEIPEPVIMIYFSCYVSAPKNSLRNAPLSLTGLFTPHEPDLCSGKICIWYGGKKENRNGGSVQQLEEIARSDGFDYLVHEPEPTDYALLLLSTHGGALVTLRQVKPRTGRKRVSKRKR